MADDALPIIRQKSEFREGFNTGDIDRIMAVFAPLFTDMSAGQPSFFGPEAPGAMRTRLEGLFADYHVKLTVSMIAVSVSGDVGSDFGWHKLWLTPRKGGETIYSKQRYCEAWRRQPDGTWKITLIITNREERPLMQPVAEGQALAELAWVG